MSSEANKALVRAFIDAISRDDPNWAETFFAPDVVCYAGGAPEPVRGREANRQMDAHFRRAFSNVRYSVEDMIAEGDRVALRRTWSMRHTGPYGELAPTGKEITGTAMDFFRIANGQIAEMWTESDNLSFMQALGAIPASEGGI